MRSSMIYYPLTRKFLPLFVCIFFSGSVFAGDSKYPERPLLKVCADPALMPLSNRAGEGMENKIAELLATTLNAKLHYEWFPQRIGFIRNTLRAEEGGGVYKCDVVLSVPEHFELAETTKPYYATTYVLTYLKGGGLDSVTSSEQLKMAVDQGQPIKFGLFDRGPAQLWVHKQGLMEYMIPYQFQSGDPDKNPSEFILQDIVDGKIDITIVTSPFAGYFSKRRKDSGEGELVLLPLKNDPDDPRAQYVYNLSMGVRHGDSEWRDQLNDFIDDHQAKINEIIKSYGIPLTEVIAKPRPDDD